MSDKTNSKKSVKKVISKVTKKVDKDIDVDQNVETNTYSDYQSDTDSVSTASSSSTQMNDTSLEYDYLQLITELKDQQTKQIEECRNTKKKLIILEKFVIKTLRDKKKEEEKKKNRKKRDPSKNQVNIPKSVHKTVTDFLKLEEGTLVSHSKLCKGIHDHIKNENLKCPDKSRTFNVDDSLASIFCKISEKDDNGKHVKYIDFKNKEMKYQEIYGGISYWFSNDWSSDDVEEVIVS